MDTKTEGDAKVEIDTAKAEEFKSQGNKLVEQNNFMQAVQLYSLAIQHDPTNAIYWANRAFCHIKMENYGLAISDATTGISANKNYAKAYYRRGSAYMALGNYKEGLKNFQQVLKLAPSDKNAQSHAKECEKQVRAAAFLRAIDNEATRPVSETITWKDVVVSASYDGPRWEDDVPNVTIDFIKQLMAHFKEQKRLHLRYAYRIILAIIIQLRSLPTLVDIPIEEGTHLTVCGDVHGQFYDVLNIFEINGLPGEGNPYLFNGDFVDRGSFSLEVILLFFSFKLAFPRHFHLTRGNHESRTMNEIYGFKGEVTTKLSAPAVELFHEAFNYLPLAALIGGKVLVVHGGLFSEDGVKLDDIRKIDRNMQPPDKGLMCELLWSDPQPMRGRAPSKRGVGLSFGPDVTQRFLDDNNLKLLIRSHEVKMEGYEVEANGRLITVFSAPNYCDSMGNKGAFVRLEHDLEPRMTSFSAVPHPNIAPMAYSSPLYRM